MGVVWVSEAAIPRCPARGPHPEALLGKDLPPALLVCGTAHSSRAAGLSAPFLAGSGLEVNIRDHWGHLPISWPTEDSRTCSFQLIYLGRTGGS